MGEEKRNVSLSTAVCIVPIIEAAMKQNWLTTLLVMLGANAITLIKTPEKVSQWNRYGRVILLAVIVPVMLDRAYSGWPGKWSEYVIPALIIILALLTACCEETKTVVMVLRYGVYEILLLVALSGIKNTSIENIYPRAEMVSGDIALIAVIPLIINRSNKPIMCLTTAGVLSSVLGYGYLTLYHYSRSLSISGVAEHIESLVSCVSMVSYYGLVSVMIESIMMEVNKHGTKQIVTIIGLILALYLTGIRINEYALGIGVVLMWVILPNINSDETKRKKVEIRY